MVKINLSIEKKYFLSYAPRFFCSLHIASLLTGQTPSIYGRDDVIFVLRKGYTDLPIAEAGSDEGQYLISRFLEDAATTLNDEFVNNAEKRVVCGTVVKKVMPHKEGDRCRFRPQCVA